MPELKKAYRDAARIYHPDKNLEVDTTDKFLEVQQAQEVLSNDFFRTQYDLFFQTKFEQEDALLKQLELQHAEKEEIRSIFMTYMKSKKTILAIVEAAPSAIAWSLTSILLVNVSLGNSDSILAFLWPDGDCVDMRGKRYIRGNTQDFS